MSVRRMQAGAVDQSVVLTIIDAVDGTPEVGVLFNTAGMDLWYRRELAAKVSITEVTLAALTTAHADGGFLEIGNGKYRLDLPDAAVAVGVAGVQIGGTVTGMVVLGPYIELEDSPLLSMRTNVAQAGAASTITLDAGASSIDDFYTNALITIKSGTGAGQARFISDYDGTARIATVNRAWATIPDATSVFAIVPFDGEDAPTAPEIADAVLDELLSGHTTVGSLGQRLQAVRTGTAQAGAAGTITLDAGASAVDGFYVDALVFITGGTGAGQVRRVTAYNGTTRVATVDRPWSTVPGASSIFVILPMAEMSDRIVPTGTVVSDAGNTALLFKTNRTEAVTGYWIGAYLRFTSGALVDQVKKIAGYNGTTKVMTMELPFTSTPTAGDTFEIVNQ